jgi:hypothetical protein
MRHLDGGTTIAQPRLSIAQRNLRTIYPVKTCEHAEAKQPRKQNVGARPPGWDPANRLPQTTRQSSTFGIMKFLASRNQDTARELPFPSPKLCQQPATLENQQPLPPTPTLFPSGRTKPADITSSPPYKYDTPQQLTTGCHSAPYALPTVANHNTQQHPPYPPHKTCKTPNFFYASPSLLSKKQKAAPKLHHIATPRKLI